MKSPKAKTTLSPARLAACRASIRKAQEANRTKPMSPARLAALRKAIEANRRNWRMTPARLAAMRVNARKMQAASVAKFQMTEKRRAALRENVKKAQAAWRASEKRKRPSYNDLKHGAYARHVEETLRRLGEDPKEYETLHEMLARLFAPQDDKEKAVVRRLGDLIWQRRRVVRAEVRWEKDRLRSLVDSTPAPESLGPYETRDRAGALWDRLFDDAQRFERMTYFQSCIETQLRKLLRLRTEGLPVVWKVVKDFKPTYWKEDAEGLPNLAWAMHKALNKLAESVVDEGAEELFEETGPDGE